MQERFDREGRKYFSVAARPACRGPYSCYCLACIGSGLTPLNPQYFSHSTRSRTNNLGTGRQKNCAVAPSDIKTKRKMRKNKRSEISRVLLRVNPAVEKTVQSEIDLLEKIQKKENRFFEQRQKTLNVAFHKRRMTRQKFYQRLRPTLSPTVRQAIDKYKKEFRKIKDQEEIEDSKSSKSPDNVASPDTNIEETKNDNDEIEDESFMISSRRSSLKSSILDFPESSKENDGSNYDDGEGEPDGAAEVIEEPALLGETN